MVDLGEDLISVFMRNTDEPPRVFKLDQMMMMEWVGVKDISGAALFVDYWASFGGVSPGVGNVNMIYFQVTPRMESTQRSMIWRPRCIKLSTNILWG